MAGKVFGKCYSCMGQHNTVGEVDIPDCPDTTRVKKTNEMIMEEFTFVSFLYSS